MTSLLVLLSFGLAAVAAPSEDAIIDKLDDGGPRYQYMTGPDGIELVDLWLKPRDLRDSDRYDPAINNNYHLFTRNNLVTSQVFTMQTQSDKLTNSYYDVTKETVVIIHGWKNVPTSDFNVLMRNACLTAKDVNLIMVDWSAGADAPYLVAMNNCIKSGEQVAKFITWLIKNSSGDISRFHIIGHSLGAHQAGIVGRHLSGNVPYITGLDPAMPGWLTHPQALSKDVSLYTEVIHTDVGFSGILTPAGHVDFYPNGGSDMPGCDSRSCNHHRAILYMAESLTGGGFTGRHCRSFVLALTGACDEEGTLKMGGPTPKNGYTGVYYLTTNAESPYSQG